MNPLAESIKSALSMRDVAEIYGFHPNHASEICCPFHTEKTPSLHIYKTPGRGWHCYGCDKGGSVIDFVMLLFGIPFSAACVRLNADFNLGLSGAQTDPREIERLRARQREARRTAQAEADEYNAHMAEYARLDLAKIHKAPPSPDEDFDPEYVEACKRIDAVWDWLDEHRFKR